VWKGEEQIKMKPMKLCPNIARTFVLNIQKYPGKEIHGNYQHFRETPRNTNYHRIQPMQQVNSIDMYQCSGLFKTIMDILQGFPDPHS